MNDATTDSDELQALFDSLSQAPVGQVATEVTPEPAAPAAAPPAASADVDGTGDSSELQSLFDSVSDEFNASADDAAPAAESEGEPAAQDGAAASGDKQDNIFNSIGQLTRKVHDTLRALGSDTSLKDAVLSMPDVRQRLDYITQMTEQAASRVLNATDIAQPLQDRIQNGSEALAARWDKLFANELSVEEFKTLAQETRAYLASTSQDAKAVSEQLLEIMMAQDFQDLTGQVIKKVVDLAQVLEKQLLGVLLEITPPEKLVASTKSDSLMNGPVINAGDSQDVVTNQEQVDDLLDSLGF